MDDSVNKGSPTHIRRVATTGRRQERQRQTWWQLWAYKCVKERGTNAWDYCVSVLEKLLGHIVGQWILHHDNAHPHMAHLVQEWLERHDIAVMVHSAYSPDLASRNFWLYPTLKCDLRSQFFESDEVIHRIQKSLHAYPRPNFAKQLKKNGLKGWNSVLRVREGTSKKMLAIRMIPNVKMTICNHFSTISVF